jgi:hypothetical protein
VRADEKLAPDRERVVEIARAEIETSSDAPDALPHIFRILGLAFDRDTLELSLAALRSDDSTLRGTSFEYLENTLPDSLRVDLWPRLEAFARTVPPPRPSASRRSQRELADELRRSREAIAVDRKAILHRRR